MNTTLIDEYRKAHALFMASPDRSADEDKHLDTLDSVWYRMTKEERAEVRAYPVVPRSEDVNYCCHACWKEIRNSPILDRMILCDVCGNKRCPKANDHRNACTNSNEPGQKGSAYA